MEIVAKVVADGSANQWSNLMWVGQGVWVTVGDDAADLWRLVDGQLDH